jgi:DNA-binding transcriptional LysR family regulator
MKHQVSKSETTRPDVADLRAFCAVVDRGSITVAAKTLGETKGSVSRRLTRLERIVGVTLLRRSPRLVQPTEDGAAYRLRVGRVLELLDEAHAQLQHASEQPHGHLRITAPYDLATSVFAPHLAAFSQRYPDISLELLLTDALLDFDADQVDVALRAAATLQDSSLIARKLVDLEGALFASPEYLARSGTPTNPSALEQHRLLVVHAPRGVASFSIHKRGAKRRRRLRLRAAISASDYGFCRSVALAGAGIAVLPSPVALGDVEAGTLVPVLSDYVLFEASTYLVYPATKFLPHKVKVFRDFMVGVFER